MSLFRSIVQNDLSRVHDTLQKCPNAIHESMELSLGNLHARITPTFLATVLARSNVLNYLRSRNILNLNSENRKELFYAGCLAKRRNSILYVLEEAHFSKQDMIRAFKFVISPEFKVYQLALQTLLTNSSLDITTTFDEIDPLEIAYQIGHLDYIKQHEPPPYFKNEETPAFVAAGKGHVDVLEYLVQTHHLNLNEAVQRGESQGMTLGYIACEVGSLEVIEYLIEKGINPFLPLPFGEDPGALPIMVAAHCGHVNVIKFAHENGYIELDQSASEGKLAGARISLVAAAKGRVNILSYLHEKGVDLSAEGSAGIFEDKTPAILAAEAGDPDVLSFLHDTCKFELLEPIASGKFAGKTLLDIARECNQKHVVAFLEKLKQTEALLQSRTSVASADSS